MKHLIRIIIVIAIVTSQWSIANSQSISRKVISSAGGTLTGGGNMLTYSIGEPAVHTLTTGSNIVTQGFEQPGEQITTGSVTPLSYCAGSGVSIPFNAIDIGGGNIFTAQLSNAAGSFAAPVNIGTLTGNASGSISATIPSNTPPGSGYRIRVVSNSPGKTGSDNGTNIAVSTGAPSGSAAAVTGPGAACNGSISSVTVNTISGVNISYSWNTGSNSSVVKFSTSISGPFVNGPFQTTTNSVYAQFGALAGSSGYNVCVQGVNDCGSTNNKCTWVRGTVSVPGTITPANGVVACPNEVKSYSCGASGGATVYNWTLAGSAVPVISGQGTQNVQVNFPAAFTSGQLCVTASLSCGGSSTSAPRCMTISKNPAVPGAFTSGPSNVCPGSTGIVYSVPAVPGATGYAWTTPAGTTIASGQNTPSISVNFPNPYTGAPPVCVTATSACGASVARCKTVGSNIPVQPGTMAGPTSNICNSTVQYSIANVPGATGYTWTPPAGTTITSGQSSTTIMLSVSSSFTSGYLTVTANSTACTPGTSTPRTITISGKPNTPAAMTANPGSWCNGGYVNFNALVVTPQPTYNWTVTNGIIQAGQGSNNIDVQWGTGTGTVKVSASNGCGTSSVKSQSFTTSCREEENIEDMFDVNAYPNPSSGDFTITVQNGLDEKTSVNIIDAAGRSIQDIVSAASDSQIRISNLPSGVYSAVITNGENRKILKLIKVD